GGGGLAERRALVVRTEDFILLVIGLSWLAKTAVNKELGLVAKTPLNRPIVLYVTATLLATLVGYLTGTVGTATGFFYVLKYVEYFFVYYMAVNNLRDRPHAWRMVVAAFLTAALASLVGAAQIPSGERVSAPFEGEVGEPNTFGGYLLLLMAIAGGVALETDRLRVRLACLALVGLMSVPFAFTLSRASYLGVPAVLLVLAALSRQRTLMRGLVVLAPALALVLAVLLPGPVVDRIAYTFQPEAGQPTVRLGRVGLDPSTSARLISFRQAMEGWWQRPVLGWGVTGFGFMDAQYPRALVETGVVGFAAFIGLLWAVLRSGRAAHAALRDREDRGLALGFLAGTAGLAVHAIGANSFIIVRIMEPFWLFAGIVVMLPVLPPPAAGASPRPAPVRPPARPAVRP
ncbi:MAG TPA: O-antigen ligase family protein, partial [Methylomirabilota bacterium]|nr:O-antigen ligase family protein [Methylomirabilota bacterium]